MLIIIINRFFNEKGDSISAFSNICENYREISLTGLVLVSGWWCGCPHVDTRAGHPVTLGPAAAARGKSAILARNELRDVPELGG